jgi:hypothetical protein
LQPIWYRQGSLHRSGSRPPRTSTRRRMFSACCANEERASVAPRLQGAISMGYAQFNACLDSRESARMEFRERQVPEPDASAILSLRSGAGESERDRTLRVRHRPWCGSARPKSCGLVSAAGIRLDHRKTARPFKGIFCDDISEFESSHPAMQSGLHQLKNGTAPRDRLVRGARRSSSSRQQWIGR